MHVLFAVSMSVPNIYLSLYTHNINKLLSGWLVCTIFITAEFSHSFSDPSQLVNKDGTHSPPNHEVLYMYITSMLASGLVVW